MSFTSSRCHKFILYFHLSQKKRRFLVQYLPKLYKKAYKRVQIAAKYVILSRYLCLHLRPALINLTFNFYLSMFQNWLKPLDDKEFDLSSFEDYQFGKQVQIFRDTLPDLSNSTLAIIGIGEKDANAIRKELYSLSFSFKNLDIVDLGNMRKNEISFIIPLIKELQDSKIFPLILGNDSMYLSAQYKAFQRLQQLISLIVIDEKIRYHSNKKANPHFYLNDILGNQRSKLFHLGLIGCQAHFINPAHFDLLNKRHFECIRLGKAHSELSEIEPIIRDGDLLGFNLAALKQIEAPGQSLATPSGFSLDEACQISRYAGMSDKLKSFGIYGFRKANDRKVQTAQAVAQMIWYFIDGFYNRKNDYPVSNEGLVEYIVDFKNQEYQLTFWKSKRSGRWWMQIPIKTNKKYQRHRLIPCSYNDYKLAGQGDLPERLLKALRRFG